LQVLALTDSLQIQRQAASHHYKSSYGYIQPLPFNKAEDAPQNQRIKIGYFSQDFREHAVSFLTAELFELHDRKRFEVIAFHYGERKDEPMQHRLRKAFDQFHDVKDLTDEAIVQMARDMDLDIAVDLAGFTANNRSGIFARRAAPVQINYIGYPASMGHPQMDYIIGDPIVTPPELHAGYSEKIISLPCFQVNDRQRKISDRVFTREELGIPEHQFVFCCFNATYKITPRVFDAWLQILKACPESCMLLVKDHDQSEVNLKQLAKAQGVDVERLIFCTKESPADNLARYRVADLFLDSTPFNAGTTASDALWAGLPVLTCAGEAFASRMAASLLHAVGLPELVTHSLNEYQRKAIELAQSTDGTKAFKQRLVDHRESCVLFDTPMFVVHLEAALIAINQAGNSH
jgi:predicted O-linked N-acetylglucosamine transferase (SPINDLY family)